MDRLVSRGTISAYVPTSHIRSDLRSLLASLLTILFMVGWEVLGDFLTSTSDCWTLKLAVKCRHITAHIKRRTKYEDILRRNSIRVGYGMITWLFFFYFWLNHGAVPPVRCHAAEKVNVRMRRVKVSAATLCNNVKAWSEKNVTTPHFCAFCRPPSCRFAQQA